MHIFEEIEPLKAFLRQKRKSPVSVGFVPTMGALHQGHISLIQASKKENQLTVCSIYINPTQFNNPSDLERYPRTLEQDIAMLKEAGCDVLFCPSNKEMYPEKESGVKIDFGGLGEILEGKFRPGHFNGVGLVVSKLFHIVEPDTAYFGQKDFQQVKIIELMIRALKFNVQLKVEPILRESDGLAMSSRNKRLNETQRKKAVVFFQSLKKAQVLLKQGTSLAAIKEEIQKDFSRDSEMRFEYLELADATNLSAQENVSDSAVLLIAGYVGEIRLIDNILIE